MKKLSFLFALLCASVMGWATDWTGYVVGSAPNVTIGDNAPVSINYKVNYLVEYNAPTLTITIDFSEANGLDQAPGFSPQIFVNGAYKGNFSGNTWSSSDYSEGTTLSIYFYFAYQFDANGSSQFNYTIPAASSGGGGGGSSVTEASCTKVVSAEGYRYTYSNDASGAVTLVVTLDEALSGVANPQVYNKSNVATNGSTSDGKVFTFSLGTFSEGTLLEYRTYFPNSDGVYQKQWLHLP